MKIHLPAFVAVALSVAVLSGCSSESEQSTDSPVIRPVKTLVVGMGDQSLMREFPARVLASNRADMAFRVAGKVNSILVKEGDKVAAGTVLATLDDTNFKLAVSDTRATLQRTQADFKRAQELIQDNFISKKDFEQLRANLTRAKAAYERAATELSYTKLMAPFDGFVAKREIQNFENVEAKQVVFAFQNLKTLELKFNVPEKLVRQINDEPGAEPVAVPVLAYFDAAREIPYPVTITEMASKADVETQTFEVTVTMAAPTDQTILPGMTGYVRADFSNFQKADEAIQVPVAAVVGNNAHQATVWVVAKDNTVAPRAVTVSTMSGDRISITSGLAIGERIVTAGVPFLIEGMQVSLMPEIDQAQ